ncbi:MAG TPA: hypothetical protein PK636_02265 [bacterium]|nr:hypothetical protein [bacterium]HPJ71491.1 hypothetical protein [bacterium]HPQ66676.1 hypothetical protein [bacterium]
MKVLRWAVAILACWGAAASAQESGRILYDNSYSKAVEGMEALKRGEYLAARESLSSAAYFAGLLATDFPDWTPAAPAPSPTPVRAPGERVQCYWSPFVLDDEWELDEGDVFEIELLGERKADLRLRFRRMGELPAGDPRISVYIDAGSTRSVLQDTANAGLFNAETGEFPLALFVPEDSPVFITAYPVEPGDEPKVLSTIEEVP